MGVAKRVLLSFGKECPSLLKQQRSFGIIQKRRVSFRQVFSSSHLYAGRSSGLKCRCSNSAKKFSHFACAHRAHRKRLMASFYLCVFPLRMAYKFSLIQFKNLVILVLSYLPPISGRTSTKLAQPHIKITIIELSSENCRHYVLLGSINMNISINVLIYIYICMYMYMCVYICIYM